MEGLLSTGPTPSSFTIKSTVSMGNMTGKYSYTEFIWIEFIVWTFQTELDGLVGDHGRKIGEGSNL